MVSALSELSPESWGDRRDPGLHLFVEWRSHGGYDALEDESVLTRVTERVTKKWKGMIKGEEQGMAWLVRKLQVVPHCWNVYLGQEC
jgi:hypothetical protein